MMTINRNGGAIISHIIYMGIAWGLFNLPETLFVSSYLYVHVVYNGLLSFKFTVSCSKDFGPHNISFMFFYNDLTDYSFFN